MEMLDYVKSLNIDPIKDTCLEVFDFSFFRAKWGPGPMPMCRYRRRVAGRVVQVTVSLVFAGKVNSRATFCVCFI